MAMEDDLRAEVTKIFRDRWATRDGRVVPAPQDLQLGNDAIKLEAAVLYADLDSSTKLVDTQTPEFAAEVYKTYLACAARIVKAEGGVITAYDGDRIMGVFIGDYKCSYAAKAALKINYAVSKIINPALSAQYPASQYVVKHVVGIDVSNLLAARIGVRNDNDLVWVGRAANYAAKLCALNDHAPVFITGDVFDRLADDSKFGGQQRQLMWQERTWTAMNAMRVFSSSWIWTP
jgi:class 3 adenylate cyclase